MQAARAPFNLELMMYLKVIPPIPGCLGAPALFGTLGPGRGWPLRTLDLVIMAMMGRYDFEICFRSDLHLNL